MVQDCARRNLAKDKEEGRALARRRLRPCASAMLVDDTLHGGKPDACGGKTRGHYAAAETRGIDGLRMPYRAQSCPAYRS